MTAAMATMAMDCRATNANLFFMVYLLYCTRRMCACPRSASRVSYSLLGRPACLGSSRDPRRPRLKSAWNGSLHLPTGCRSARHPLDAVDLDACDRMQQVVDARFVCADILLGQLTQLWGIQSNRCVGLIDDAHVLESGAAYGLEVLVLEDSPRDALDIGLYRCSHLLRQFFQEDQVRDHEPATRPQDPVQFPEHLFLFRHKVDHAIRDGDVDRTIGQGKRLDVSEQELDVAIPPDLRVGSRLGNHLRRHVHADDPAGLSDSPGGKKGVEPCTGPQIENDIPFLQGREGERVATAEAQVCAILHCMHLCIGIADFPAELRGGVIRCRAAASTTATGNFALGDFTVLFLHSFLHPFARHRLFHFSSLLSVHTARITGPRKPLTMSPKSYALNRVRQ